MFGVNAHADIDHNLVIMEAFQEACEQKIINACYAFDEWRFPHFGLDIGAEHLCPVKSQEIKVSEATVPDVHGGDIETAMIHAFYPSLVDVEKAKGLPPVPLADDDAGKWLFGDHIHDLSTQGYLGSPADFETVNVKENIEDYAQRITEAIKLRII